MQQKRIKENKREQDKEALETMKRSGDGACIWVKSSSKDPGSTARSQKSYFSCSSREGGESCVDAPDEDSVSDKK
jgi:hypothetical protein